jgi:acetyl esterase/lipase
MSIADAPDIPTAQANLLAAIGQVMAAGLMQPPDLTGVDKTEIQIPTRDGASLRALVYKPQQAPKDGSPLAVLYHGGGWSIGMAEMEEANATTIVQKYGGVAVSVDYRMAPDHVFPTAINDSFDALKWVRFCLLHML